ncbi:hypothetical protein K7X08_035923 [Anisodus acutangulus]|uniref:Uncharacterized protein n=1 Tax=Anisodus acutangulus TaxID=402998 RepID=A0A9Q1L485_9SOLA|nr:hypothetical protein K7X08_035923 [Anisodus acutangulus]
MRGDEFLYCTRCGSQANDIIDTGVDQRRAPTQANEGDGIGPAGPSDFGPSQGEIDSAKRGGSNKTEPHNLLAREAILPTDILKWTFEGKLPYFAAVLKIEKQLGPPTKACPISTSSMFRPIQSTPLQKLEFLAAAIARRIGLELPPVNFHAKASRYLTQLSLPVEKILTGHAKCMSGLSSKVVFIR